MQIAILGTGAIGSTFAYQLARAGHDVTVIARGERLRQLQRDGAIVLTSEERASVRVETSLDTARPYDLVLVSVLATQVDALLPTLGQSVAKTVMFMFNTFEPLDRLRDAVGRARFVFGFPAGVFTLLVDGKIRPQIRAGTTVGDAAWARVFGDAGIPSAVDPDMHSWLRAHAALVIPLMSIGTVVLARAKGIAWREAAAYARAMRDGFAIVRSLGHRLAPSWLRALGAMPRALLTLLLWMMSRTTMLRDLGRLGTTEPRMLIDMMTAAAPEKTGALLAIRP